MAWWWVAGPADGPDHPRGAGLVGAGLSVRLLPGSTGRNLRKLKAAIRARWGVVPPLDMFTETALRTGCLDVLLSASTRLGMPGQELFERMLLVAFCGWTASARPHHPHQPGDLLQNRPQPRPRRLRPVIGTLPV